MEGFLHVTCEFLVIMLHALEVRTTAATVRGEMFS